MNFDNQILIICENIDKNLANNSICDERGFISQNILGQLRTLVEYIFQKIHSTQENIDTNQFKQIINENAIKYVRSKGGNYPFLVKFHSFLDKSTSHYTLSENSSERLMLKYFIYLIECKNFLKENYSIEVLKNLSKFPLNLDKKFMEYYEKIAEKLENQNILSNSSKESSAYYVTKIKPFIVKEQIYYEITFVNVVDNFNKFDKLIAFSKFRIFDNYALNLWLHNEKIEILTKQMQIKIIDDWEVAIRPAEWQNFGKIFGLYKTIGRTNEYKELMRFLTQNKISLVDLIDRHDYENIKNDIISKGNVSHIFDILDRAKSVTQDGKNTVRYLLYNLRNQIIKKQFDSNENQFLSNLRLNYKCSPFEQMPFATSLLNHNPSFYDLMECLNPAGREYEIFARAVRSKIENNGNLFVDKKDFNFNNIDGLRDKFNSLLWKGNTKNPKGHTGRRIEEFQNHFYIKEYVEKSIEIIDILGELTKSGIEGYSNSVKDWLSKNPNLINDNNKKEIIINMFEHSKVALIYGAAGTGKTKLLGYVSKFFKDHTKLFLANTNTAVDNLKRRVDANLDSDFKTVTKIASSKSEHKYDILIVDECSTISNDDMKKVLNKVQFDLILLVGDIYQIEAISFGNWFKIAQKFLKNCSFYLEKTYRTKDEKLLNLWNEVRNFGDSISEILQRENYSQRLEDLSFESKDDEIVLCLNYDGLYGINNLNTILQENNKEKGVEWNLHTYKIGDPILFNETERFKPLIYNNMKGKIVDIELENKQIWFSIEIEKTINALDAKNYDFELLENQGKSVIKFYVNKYKTADEDGGYKDDEEATAPFHVAYAISIHKAQGLEYNSVKIVISSEIDEMITHNIFYTAITRAKQNLKIYWSPEAEKKILESFRKINNNKDIEFLKKIKK
ncbi:MULTISPECIES: ATP-dependent RecD-like DNA helicase [unclassified Campylobacter]|uniref:ATP-dependent DNA helicase n=1 Tax=unclassified Campylobacter TaxID=2593542 RepID=UPI0014751090|nr:MULTISPECIES: ATP-dependent RecD-like DNA helicase [unclassified Campylobacter]